MNRTVVPSPALYPMKSKRPYKNFQPPSSVMQSKKPPFITPGGGVTYPKSWHAVSRKESTLWKLSRQSATVLKRPAPRHARPTPQPRWSD
nr:MAG TPA: hypothetical protein [Caudoviricetes sp.]